MFGLVARIGSLVTKLYEQVICCIQVLQVLGYVHNCLYLVKYLFTVKRFLCILLLNLCFEITGPLGMGWFINSAG